METMTHPSSILEDLRRRATELTGAGVALVGLLGDEASRLRRKDDVSRLRALHSTVMRELEEAKRSEQSAKRVHINAKAMTSWVGLAVGGIVKITSKGERAQAFANNVLSNLGGEDPPFGTVLICVGPKGLPDDVGVVTVSRQARESRWEESEIIDGLKRGGRLLATEGSFSLLIDRLIGDVEQGRLLLPISTEKLSKLKEPPCSKCQDGKPAWVLLYWLQ